MLKESFAVIPGSRKGFAVDRIDARLGILGQQCEIQPFDRLASFFGQLGSDALLVFKAGYLVAGCATISSDKSLAIFLERGVIHIGGVGVLNAAFALHQE